MKVLWFSNSVLGVKGVKATGTWLHTMSLALIQSGIQVFNITQSSTEKTIKYVDDGQIAQWILPVYKLDSTGLPTKDNILNIQKIVQDIQPDIIHIWGTEFYWGLLTARGFIKGNVILEIEGLMFSCSKVFYGGLSLSEILQTFRLKEIISFKRSIIGQQRWFEKWGRFEVEMLKKHKNISTQSNWVRAWIAPYSDHARIFRTGLIIRQEFYNSIPWKTPKHENLQLLSFASGADSYKGLHIVIKALSIVKQIYPNIVLKLAGNFGLDLPSYRKPGYSKFILALIAKLGLKNNVVFLGPLTAEGLVEQMLNSRAFVQASNVESYSMALAESMAVGIPSVVSFAGAMPELANNEESALFYPVNDFYSCANQIIRILDSEDLSAYLSYNARKRAEFRNTCDNVVKQQIRIYKSLY